MRLWTPADIETALWLDAADAATITTVSDRISGWSDKSGNGRHFEQVTAGSRPYYETVTLNGLKTADFAASVMVSAAPASAFNFMHDGTIHELFAVVKFGAAADPNTVYSFLGNNRGSSSGIRGFGIWFDDRASASRNNCAVHLASNGGGSAGSREVVDNVSNSGFVAPNEFGVFELFSDLSNPTAADRSTLTSDFGTPANNNTHANAPSPSNATYITELGSIGNGSFPLTGQLAELSIVSGAMALADRLRCRGYLAHKWGLVAKLPVDHPYKAAPPYVYQFSGTTRDKTGALAQRRVTVIRESDNTIVGSVLSDDTTGEYLVETPNNEPHTLVFSGEADRNAIVYSGVMPG